MENTTTAKIGGRLGDFFHSLIFCNYYYKLYNKKTKLFLENENGWFYFGHLRAYNDLKSIIEEQPYIEQFDVIENCTTSVDINLNNFRYTDWIFKTGWSDVILKKFMPDITYRFRNTKTLHITTEPKYSDTVVIHRKPRGEFTDEIRNMYESAIKNFNCIFLVEKHNIHLYDELPLQVKPELVVADSLYDICKIINSAKYYIGNETGYTAIAHTTNTPRLVELLQDLDAPHYTEEIKYFDNLSYITTGNFNTYYISQNSIFYGI